MNIEVIFPKILQSKICFFRFEVSNNFPKAGKMNTAYLNLKCSITFKKFRTNFQW